MGCFFGSVLLCFGPPVATLLRKVFRHRAGVSGVRKGDGLYGTTMRLLCKVLKKCLRIYSINRDFGWRRMGLVLTFDGGLFVVCKLWIKSISTHRDKLKGKDLSIVIYADLQLIEFWNCIVLCY